MTDNNTYIVYYTRPLRIQKTTDAPKNVIQDDADIYPAAQQAWVGAFVHSADRPKTILESYCDIVQGRHHKHWPELIKATEACQRTGAILLIAELGHLTANAYFMEILLGAEVPLYCCDQSFMTAAVLEAYHKHALVHRGLHSQAICAGLSKGGRIRGRRKHPAPTEIAEALEA
jgi:hypothetical protein